MGRMTPLLAALLPALLVGGCATEDRPETAPATKAAVSSHAPAAPQTAQGSGNAAEPTRPSTQEATAREPEPQPPAPDDFDGKLAEVLALEQEGRIFDAMKLCLGMRRDYKGHAKAMSLDAVATRLRAAKRTAAELTGVIEKLVSPRADVAEVARRQVTEAGDVGRILLRKTVRDRSDAVAAAAAGLLVELRDPRAPLAFAATLAHDPPKPLRAALCTGLAALVDLTDEQVCASLWAAVKDDEGLKNWDRAGVLCSVLTRRCGGDQKLFGEMVKDPDAHAKLSAYVRKALGSEDAAAAEWARSAALTVGCAEKGLRGSYFEGLNFEKLVAERLDAKVDFTHKSLAYPEGRANNASVRWTGFLRVQRGGTFMFSVVSDDGERLWVNNLPLLDDWTMHGAAENLASVELTEGFHPLRLEYMNGDGGGCIKLSWSGPGFSMRLITAEDLRTLPWKGMRKAKAPD